jgi:hypothetical protein
MPKNELFIIPAETIIALDQREIDATVEGLKTLDLFRLPYPTVDIQLPVVFASDPNTPEEKRCKVGSGGNAVCRLVGCRLDGTFNHTEFELFQPTFKGHRIFNSYSIDNTKLVQQVTTALVVLLATRNAAKTTTLNKLARLGIGKNSGQRSYPRVTTISLPDHLEPDPDNPPPDKSGTVCPHLRRGHIRRQHYGPKNCMVKQVWIEPVFVNADPDFVSTRERYNLSGIAAKESTQ